MSIGLRIGDRNYIGPVRPVNALQWWFFTICVAGPILIGFLLDEVATGGAVRRAVTRSLERA